MSLTAGVQSLVIMMNRKTAEKIAAMVLFAVLAIIFVMQNAHALSTAGPFVDNGKCLEMTPYYFGHYDGKQAGLIAFYQVDESCDSTTPMHQGMYITEQQNEQ